MSEKPRLKITDIKSVHFKEYLTIGDYMHGFSIMENPPTVKNDGLITVPDGPGLGVEINRDLIKTL